MRLDLFLKASRLCPRRTIAQKLCDAGLVSINGSTAKSAHQVKPADEIIIKRRDKVSTIRVLSVPLERQTSRKDAGSFYEIIEEHKVNEDVFR